MTVTSKIEQVFFTDRPNSYVPAHTLERLLRLPVRPDEERFGLNMAMHYGQGAVAGIVRAVMAMNGVMGPFASFMFTGVRLLIDQTLENWTGVGALPWLVFPHTIVVVDHADEWMCCRTWPVNEQVIDLLHKSVYAFVTGWFVDKWLGS